MTAAWGEIPRPAAPPAENRPAFVPSRVAGAGTEAQYLREAEAYLQYERKVAPQARPAAAPLAWLESIYSQVARGDIDRAIDTLFKNVDAMLGRGEFVACDGLLRAIDLKRLDTNLLVAALTITLPAANALRVRKRFVERVERRLKEIAPERYARLLSGLR